MKAPAAVRVACQPSSAWRLFQAGLASLATAVLLLWGQQQAGHFGAGIWPLALLAGLLAGVLVWRMCPDALGTLAWDGVVWSWLGVGQSQAVTLRAVDVALDLHVFMLLRLQVERGDRDSAVLGDIWLLLSQSKDPASWPTLCTALYAQRTQPQSLAVPERRLD
jgi:hypothetical protein